MKRIVLEEIAKRCGDRACEAITKFGQQSIESVPT